MQRIEVRETNCKTVLHRMTFMGRSEYTANLYRGCTHGCVYCYAPSLIHDERPWGSFVDVKVNADKVLERESRRMSPTDVFLSSASDPYQPVEARYGLTRRCLEILLRRRFRVAILTRSPLVLRDLDLLRRSPSVSVGFSISSVSRRSFEPGVPPLERRLMALGTLAEAGVRTWVSMAPIIPSIVLDDVEALAGRLREAGVSYVSTGTIRWSGYEGSREFFQERVGIDASSLPEDPEGVVEGVRRVLRENGLVVGSGREESPPGREAATEMTVPL